jgi:hypothetical protein
LTSLNEGCIARPNPKGSLPYSATTGELMWSFYRRARRAGYSVADSLAFALFNKELPSKPLSIQEREAIHRARVADFDKRSRERTQSTQKDE